LVLLLLAFFALPSFAASQETVYERLMRKYLPEDEFTPRQIEALLITGRDPAELFAGLKSRDPRTREECAFIMGWRGDAGAAAALVPLLQDKVGYVRLQALQSLGELHDPATLPAVAEMLEDSEQEMQAEATSALGNFGKAAVPILIEALDHEDQGVRSAAMTALAATGDPAAVTPVVDRLANADLTLDAVLLLGKIGLPAVEVLAEALPNVEPELRQFVVRGLAGIDDPRAREAVYAACGDDDPRVRCEAVSHLRADNPRELELLLADLEVDSYDSHATTWKRLQMQLLDERAFDRLLPLLSREKADQCYTAASRLACFRDPRLIEPALALMQDPEYLMEGLTLLEAQRDPRSIPALLAVLSAKLGEDEVIDTGDDTLHGDMATWAMVRLGQPAVEPLLRLARAAEPLPRCRAATALGALCHPNIIPALIGLLDDLDVTVRLAAIDALGRQGDMRGYEALMPLLGDKEAEIRQAAAEALAGCLDQRMIDPLVKMMDERDAASRAFAAEALSYFSDGRVPPLMLRALRDKDDLVYMCALDGNGRWVTDRRIADALLALYDRSNHKYETIDRLRTADPVAVPSLLKALKSRDAGRRAVAAEALGAFDTPEAREALLSALIDDDEYVRNAAGTSLGEFADPAILPRLAAILQKTRDTAVRADLIRAMRFYGAPAADVLLPLLPAPGSVQERCSIILSLGETGDSRAVEPLIAELRNVKSPCRVEAAQALRELGDARAVEPFIAVLEDTGKNARPAYWFTAWWQGEDRYSVAIEALGKLKDPRAVKPLMRALANEENPFNTAGIIDSLRRIGDRRAMETIRPYLAKSIAFDERGEEMGGHVLKAAAYAAGELGDTRDAEWLRELLRAHLFDVHADTLAKDCRRALAWAVGVEEKEQIEPLLIAAFREDLYDGDLTTTAKALARLDTPRAADELRAALAVLDNEGAVEDRPLLLGLCLGKMTAMPWERLELMLQSDNWRARKATLAAFAIRGDSLAIPQIQRALDDLQPQVRATAAMALGRLKAKKAAPALTKALADPYPEVRAAAKTALAAMGE